MKEEHERSEKDERIGLFRSFRLLAHEFPGLTARDRYKILKIRLFFLIGALAGVPLLLVVVLGFFWLRTVVDESFNNYLSWQIENTKQSIEIFLREKVSGLKFLVAAYSFEQLSNQKTLHEIFSKRKREFGELVDLGVIDSKGIQRAYAGPYDLLGKDYSTHDWFQKVAVRGVYVSDVFLGYRRIPHVAVAVKQEAPGGFWVVRATIDLETLSRLVHSITLKEGDDAFLLNEDGILQTPSRFYGKLLEKVDLEVTPENRGFTLLKMKSRGAPITFGYTKISDSPWILGVVVKYTSYMTMVELLKSHMAALYLVLALVGIGILMNYRTSRMVVNWIEEADKKREEAIAQTEHSAKLASIGRLAAGVAHEINNPLAIINEKAGLLKDLLMITEEAEPCREKFLPIINSISGSVDRCRTITHRLLGFARRMDVRIEEIDLNDAINEVIGFLEREILYRDIRLDLRLSQNLPQIESDRGQLQQVFLNIVNNAIDAVDDEGHITIETGVADASHLKVLISDDGHGIPKEVLKHIFEPFYTTKEKGKGTGLGLSLS
ncbi:MAG TPA: cache domain-containing protein, partial [Dissulfurispiraceae bacterium]|nr:cache domain-containing protein [Dissulfurispiraceae bacterium]